MKRSFADALKAERESAGLSMRELADRVTALGVKLDSSTVHRMEHGQREPKLSEALAISRLLHFDLGDLATPADTAAAVTELLANETMRAIGALVDVGVASRVLSQALNPGVAGTPGDRSAAIEGAVLGIRQSVRAAAGGLSTDEWDDYRSGLLLLGIVTDIENGAGDGASAAP